MQEKRPIRLISKRKLQERSAGSSEVPKTPQAPTEREISTVISRWVRDHRQRAEEYRQASAALLGGIHLHARQG
jgi:hypothetical protein